MDHHWNERVSSLVRRGLSVRERAGSRDAPATALERPKDTSTAGGASMFQTSKVPAIETTPKHQNTFSENILPVPAGTVFKSFSCFFWHKRHWVSLSALLSTSPTLSALSCPSSQSLRQHG